ILAGRAMGPMALVASLLTRLQQSRRSLLGLNQIMEMPVERESRGASYVSVPHFQSDINIENLRFSYDPQAAPILDGINLTIRPGEKVALLGKVGSGKSTLLRLLMGFDQPTDGSISMSGIDLQQFDPAELRRHIGYLPQDPCLLYGTLRSNLKAGCAWVDDSLMLQAIEAAGLAGFIRSLPRGIDHPVAEGGRSLSGGQRQAIAIARALIEMPHLLVFDEPTSAMDTASEKHFLSYLDKYLNATPGRTMVIATHKKSVLSSVDRVVVIDGGKVVADGPRDEVVLSGHGSARQRQVMPEDASPEAIDDLSLPS
ncbi:MAG: ATP-binding cassette domain-containing protein, partial [Verrucomicrobiota bacterium]